MNTIRTQAVSWWTLKLILSKMLSVTFIPGTYNILNYMKFEPKYLKFNDCLK